MSRAVRDSIASFKNALKEQQQQQQQQHEQQTEDISIHPNSAHQSRQSRNAPLSAQTQSQQTQRQSRQLSSQPPQQQPPQQASQSSNQPLAGRKRAVNGFFRESPSRVTNQLSTLDVSDGAAQHGLFSFGKRSATFKRRFVEQQQQQQHHQQESKSDANRTNANDDEENAPEMPPPRRRLTSNELFRRAFEASEYKRKLVATVLSVATPPHAPDRELAKQGIALGAQWTLARQQLQESMGSSHVQTHGDLVILEHAQAALSTLGQQMARPRSTTVPSFDTWRRQLR